MPGQADSPQCWTKQASPHRLAWWGACSLQLLLLLREDAGLSPAYSSLPSSPWGRAGSPGCRDTGQGLQQLYFLRGGRCPCAGPSCRIHMQTGHLRSSALGSILAHQNFPPSPEPLGFPLLSSRQQRGCVPVRCPRLPGLQLGLPGGLLEDTLLDRKVPPPGCGPSAPPPTSQCPVQVCSVQLRQRGGD